MERLYVYLMENGKPLDRGVVERHVAHLRALDHAGKLVLCGPFEDYPGGMVVLRVSSLQEAQAVAARDPFVAEGYKTCTVRTLQHAHRGNGYLL